MSEGMEEFRIALHDIREGIGTLVEQNQSFISKILSREIGQFPPDSVPLEIFNKVINRVLILCGAIVFTALGSVGYISQRSSDKAAEVAIHTAEVVKQAVETKP